MPCDELLCSDSTICLQSLKIRRQLITSAPKLHCDEKFTCLHMVSMTSIASEVNPYCFIKCAFEQTELIYPAVETRRASRFFFYFLRRGPLSGLSQYGFDQMCYVSAALINLCHLFLVPVCRPLASWHPYEADRLTAT